jgi:hypothetical protein
MNRHLQLMQHFLDTQKRSCSPTSARHAAQAPIEHTLQERRGRRRHGRSRRSATALRLLPGPAGLEAPPVQLAPTVVDARRLCHCRSRRPTGMFQRGADIAARLLECERAHWLPLRDARARRWISADLGIDSIKREIVGMIQSLTLADGVTPDVEGSRRLRTLRDAIAAPGAQCPRGVACVAGRSRSWRASPSLDDARAEAESARATSGGTPWLRPRPPPPATQASQPTASSSSSMTALASAARRERLRAHGDRVVRLWRAAEAPGPTTWVGDLGDLEVARRRARRRGERRGVHLAALDRRARTAAAIAP